MSDLFPPKGRLYHCIPGWVPDGETFHIRLRCDRNQARALTDPELAPRLLESVRQYHDKERWWCRLFLLMPDHLHALLVFPLAPGMSVTIRQWKTYHARRNGVLWQDGYFDHRIRSAAELDEKAGYIRRNPVVKGLCGAEADWRWVVDTGSI